MLPRALTTPTHIQFISYIGFLLQQDIRAYLKLTLDIFNHIHNFRYITEILWKCEKVSRDDSTYRRLQMAKKTNWCQRALLYRRRTANFLANSQGLEGGRHEKRTARLFTQEALESDVLLPWKARGTRICGGINGPIFVSTRDDKILIHMWKLLRCTFKARVTRFFNIPSASYVSSTAAGISEKYVLPTLSRSIPSKINII